MKDNLVSNDRPNCSPRRYRRRPSNAAIIAAIQVENGLLAPAARRLGVHRQRLHEWIASNQALQAVRDGMRDEVLDLAEGKLVAAVEAGDMASVCFLLRTVGRKRGYSERAEVVGSGGDPIQVIIEGPNARL